LNLKKFFFFSRRCVPFFFYFTSKGRLCKINPGKSARRSRI
jgi:hypothetical protein